MAATEEPPQEHREEYRWIEGVEYLDRYSRGGYHPVMIGDVLHRRYRIVDKLGHGGYSTVWLALDTQQGTYVALKVGVADSRPHETAVLTSLLRPNPLTPPSAVVVSAGLSAIPRLLDQFTVHGPNGAHPSYTTTVAATSLRDPFDYTVTSLNVARALAVKLVAAVAYVHSQGYVHGDIHLGNVMLMAPAGLDKMPVEKLYEKYGHPDTVNVSRLDGGPLSPHVPAKAVRAVNLGKKAGEISLQEANNLQLVDFGESFAPESTTRPCEDCRSHFAARPPESQFEPLSPLSYSADIWCLGLALWNIFALRDLFAAEFSPPATVVAQQIVALGQLPARWWPRWEQRLDYFDDSGCLIPGKDVGPSLDEAFDDWIQEFRRRKDVGVFSGEEKAAFLKLMRCMLSYEPSQRPTAAELLKSDWVVNWAMKDFMKSCK